MNYTPNRIHEHLSASTEFGELYSKMIEAKEFLIEIGYSNITPNFILDRLQNNYDCSETRHERNKKVLYGISLNMVMFLNGVVFFLGNSNPVLAARANELINQLDSFCHFEDLGLNIIRPLPPDAQYRPFIPGQPLSQFLSQLPLPPPPRAGVTLPQRVPQTVRRHPIARTIPPPPSTFSTRPQSDGVAPPSDEETANMHFNGGKRRKTGKQRKSGKRRKTGKQRKSRKH